MYQFEHIEYLLSLAAIPVMLLLFFLLLRWKKKAIKKIGDVHLVKHLIKGYSPVLFSLKFILILIAFTLRGFAIADMVKPEGAQITNRKGIDIMIALDVSNSML